MQQQDGLTQTSKFKFVTGQHGGYYRHGFVDHAYLYNCYFPTQAVYSHLKSNIRDLVLN